MARTRVRYKHVSSLGDQQTRIKVTAYVPSTSTPVTGAWDSLSGGNAVTWPLASDSQGRVTFYLDTPQDVELVVTDETDFLLHPANDRPLITAGDDAGNDAAAKGTYLTPIGRDAAKNAVTAKPLGDGGAGIIDWVHDDTAGYLIHLTSGLNYTSAAIMAIGTDNNPAGTAGLLVVNKKAGEGIRITNNNTITGGAGYGLRGVQQSTNSSLVYLEQTGSAGGAPALEIVANGTPQSGQELLRVQTAALAGRGGFGSKILSVAADTGNYDFTGPLVRLNGGILRVQQTDNTVTGNISQIALNPAANPDATFSKYSGSSGLFFSNRLITGNSTELQLQTGNGATARGSESWLTTMRSGTVSGAAGLGFFGTAPVQRPTGTPAASTDLASVISLANSLRTGLLALGLVA